MDQTLTTHLLNCWQRNLLQNLSVQYYTSHCKTHEIPPLKKNIQPPGLLVHLTTHRVTHTKIFMMSTLVSCGSESSPVLPWGSEDGLYLMMLSFHTSWNRCVFFAKQHIFSDSNYRTKNLLFEFFVPEIFAKSSWFMAFPPPDVRSMSCWWYVAMEKTDLTKIYVSNVNDIHFFELQKTWTSRIWTVFSTRVSPHPISLGSLPLAGGSRMQCSHGDVVNQWWKNEW